MTEGRLAQLSIRTFFFEHSGLSAHLLTALSRKGLRPVHGLGDLIDQHDQKDRRARLCGLFRAQSLPF